MIWHEPFYTSTKREEETHEATADGSCSPTDNAQCDDSDRLRLREPGRLAALDHEHDWHEVGPTGHFYRPDQPGGGVTSVLKVCTLCPATLPVPVIVKEQGD